MENLVSADFWKGKRVFLTGHTGFKGSWMALWLKKLGAEVTGFALAPDTEPSLYREIEKELGIKSIIGDICNFELLNKTMLEADPEIIFHMAAQPLVRYSYDHPLETFQTNIMGTANLLEAARKIKNLKSIVVITTDKVYENAEWAWSYRENDVLGGHDPYSSSKACAEIVTTAMRKSFFSKPESPGVATVRAGNVIGGGDWALDRIVPDVMAAFQKQQTVKLRNPNAIRPWQHVLEPLGGYLTLAQKLFVAPSSFASAWNFGPYVDNAVTVADLVSLLSKKWPGGKWEIDPGKHPHEAFYLKLDSSKAKHHLGWNSVLNIKRTTEMTVDWYRHFFNKEGNAFELCNKQIDEYSKELNHVAK